MKTDNRQKLLMILALAVLAVFVGDKLVFTPLTKLWEARAKEIKTLRADIADGSARIRREQIDRERWNTMRKHTLPNNPSQAQERMFKALQDWAQESGITLRGTSSQWKGDSDDYKTLVFRVDASGSLWMLTRFIYDIENSWSANNKSSQGPLGLKIESVDFSSMDNSGRQLSLGLQVSGLVLTSK